MQFGLNAGQTYSLKGHHDIANWMEYQKDVLGIYCEMECGRGGMTKLKLYARPAEIEAQLETLLANYQKSISLAKAQDHPSKDIMLACATFAHEFCLIHPFSDGNLRLSQQLLNRLLVENGLPITVLSDPSMLEGLAPDEISHEIINGFENFKVLSQIGYLPGTKHEKTALPSFFAQEVCPRPAAISTEDAALWEENCATTPVDAKAGAGYGF